MYEDQRLFNQQIWTKPLIARDLTGPEETAFSGRLKDLSLGIVEEALEFLRTFEWKVHRRRKGKLQNVAHSHEELVDMFKYWLSLCELSEFPIGQLEELYYAKSRVVQYRYQEEWFKQLDGPCVAVDIDNVLADYTAGLAAWTKEWGQQVLKLTTVESTRLILRLDELRSQRVFFNAESTGLTFVQWNELKHAFRSSGGKRTLPLCPDARPFLEWCFRSNLTILLVTSRPIDQYPNIFTDTMTWLYTNNLPFDHLWWASDKAVRLEEMPRLAQIVFAVDDDLRFIHQYRAKGVKAYWLNPQASTDQIANEDCVRSLMDIVHKEGEGDGLRRREA